LAEELERNPLWLILVETVHSLPMYPSHKAYVRDNIVLETPEITPEELSLRLNIPLGEAMVILQEIGMEEHSENARDESSDAP